MKKNALLGIDFQNDFCRPDGNLSVPGAEDDLSRIAAFINKNEHGIHYIALTQDSHQVIDISHPAFWQDSDGNFPGPYTVITAADASSGKWTPRYMPAIAIKYLEDLETQGEFPHVIWPEHCIVGSEGAAIHPILMDAVMKWSRRGVFFQIVQKGQYPMTEHFGAFRANVPVSNQPSTQLNDALIATLEKYEDIYFAGEAKTHCVANTLKQALTFPKLAQKLVILTDCMSDVPGEAAPGLTFADIAQPIYDDAKKAGIRFMKSTDVNL